MGYNYDPKDILTELTIWDRCDWNHVIQLRKDAAAEIARLTDALEEASSLIEGYKKWGEDVARLTRQIDVDMHGEDGAAKQASLCDLVGAGADLRAEVERLTSTLGMQERLWEKTVANLRAKLATSRAETAMAFEVAAQWLDARAVSLDGVKRAQSALSIHSDPPLNEKSGAENQAQVERLNRQVNDLRTDAHVIRSLTPAAATAALAARDKATREKALRDAANECENRRQGWLKPYILSIIK